TKTTSSRRKRRKKRVDRQLIGNLQSVAFGFRQTPAKWLWPSTMVLCGGVEVQAVCTICSILGRMCHHVSTPKQLHSVSRLEHSMSAGQNSLVWLRTHLALCRSVLWKVGQSCT